MSEGTTTIDAHWPLTVAPSGNVALALREARRSHGMTVGELARMADVPVGAVEAAEAGEATTAPVMESLGRTLGLAGGDHLPPTPSSPEHAALLLRLHADAVAVGGLVAAPDVRAWSRSTGWDPDRWERLLRLSERSYRWHVPACLAGFVTFVLMASLGVEARDLARDWGTSGLVGAEGGLGFLLAGVGTYLARSARRSEAIRAEVDADDLARRTHAAMSSRGCVVHAEGFSVVEADGAGDAVATVHEAALIYSVEVRDVGAAHVTVTVEGASGVTVMPWLRRSPALLDVVAGWTRPRDDRPWAVASDLGRGVGGS